MFLPDGSVQSGGCDSARAHLLGRIAWVTAANPTRAQNCTPPLLPSPG